MSDLRITHRWTDPGGAKGEELRATWGELTIEVGGQVVTRVFDHVVRTVNTYVALPLYPLAEWIAANWWSLFYEIENSHNINSPEYRTRHDISFSTGGYVLPALWIEPIGERVRLHWKSGTRRFALAEFLDTGTAYVDRRAVRDQLAQFVDIVLDRLAQAGVDDTVLQKDWSAIRSMDEEEMAFCIAAAQLGEDPYAIDEEMSDAIITAAGSVPDELRDDLFMLSTKNGLERTAKELAELIDIARDTRTDMSELAAIRSRLGRSDVVAPTPYRIGYARAQELRHQLGLNGDLLNDDRKLLEALGIGGSNAIRKHRFITHDLEGLLGFSKEVEPVFIIDRDIHQEGRRFMFGRVLHEYLFNRGREARLVTRVKSESQQINRSFAAELLAPSSVLRKRITASQVHQDEVEELAREFGVSSFIIEHQLHNHQIARVRRSG